MMQQDKKIRLIFTALMLTSGSLIILCQSYEYSNILRSHRRLLDRRICWSSVIGRANCHCRIVSNDNSHDGSILSFYGPRHIAAASISMRMTNNESNLPIHEPAGVESLFHRTVMVRRPRLKTAGSSSLSSIKKLWKRLSQLKNRNIKATSDDVIKEEMPSVKYHLNDISNDEISKTIKSLQDTWSLASPSEARQLAIMKIMLSQMTIISKDKNNDDDDDKSSSASSILPSSHLIQTYPDIYGDARLLRFLRKSYSSDPYVAALHYANFVRWRQDESVDDIRATVVGGGGDDDDDGGKEGALSESLSRVEMFVPCDWNPKAMLDTTTTTTTEDNCQTNQVKDDDDGCLTIVLDVGRWDTAGIWREMKRGNITIDSFLRYWTFQYESLHQRLYKESLRQQRLVQVEEICNCVGMTLGQFHPLFVSQVLTRWIFLTQEYYPETAKRIIFLNPPRFMMYVWKIVAPMTSQGTLDKIKLCRGFVGDPSEFIKLSKGKPFEELCGL